MPKIFFIGDIVGRPGREVLTKNLKRLREERKWDFVIANGENAAGGSGLTAALAKEITDAGVDVITLGDHIWDQAKFSSEIVDLEKVCRPANLPDVSPGRRFVIVEHNRLKVAVLTVLGQAFMRFFVTNPFQVAQELALQLRPFVDAILVEVHAEATSEKVAMGWLLDGIATAVVGTHTHIPTADAAILPKGTAYITDVGMTGPYKSVLGRQIEPILSKVMDQIPRRFDVASEDVRISGVEITFDSNTNLAQAIELVHLNFE